MMNMYRVQCALYFVLNLRQRIQQYGGIQPAAKPDQETINSGQRSQPDA